VAHINFPVDTQSMPASKGKRSERNVPGHNLEIFAKQAGLPPEEDLRRAAKILNAGERVAILAGRGALRATDELIAVARRSSRHYWGKRLCRTIRLSPLAASVCWEHGHRRK
jgi:pyruvate dehydrogenase (quinone)/pyruvate oxidase